MNKTCFKQQMWTFLFIWWRQSTLLLCWLQIYLCDLWGQKQMNVSLCSYEFITADKTREYANHVNRDSMGHKQNVFMCVCLLCMNSISSHCVCALTGTFCLGVQCVSVSSEGGVGWLAPTSLKPAFGKCHMFSQGKEFVLICRVSQMLWAGN